MKKFKIFGLVIVIFILTPVFFSGCCAIFSGTKQSVTFNSNPDGATIYVIKKNKPELAIGKTPTTMDVKKNTKKIVFKKDGYCDKEYVMMRSINGWYWVDIGMIILIGWGIIPTIIDLSTGAFIHLEKNISVNMDKKAN